MVWLAVVTVVACIVTIGQAVRIRDSLALSDERRTAALVVIAILALAMALITGVRHIWSRPMGLIALVLIPAVALALSAGTGVVGIVVVLVLPPAFVLGRVLVRGLIHDARCLESWVVGSAIGYGILAAVAVCLGMLGQLRPYWIWTIIAFVTVGIVIAGRRLFHRDLYELRGWLTSTTTSGWLNRAQAGLIVGIFWLTFLWAVVPEIMTDAVRERLPSAAYAAATGRLGTNPDSWVALRPGVSELIYSLLMSVSSVEASKLASFTAGWLAILGVGALAKRLAGDGALLPAVLAFATIPIQLRSFQTASADTFTALFAVATALLLVASNRTNLRVIPTAGVFLLLGLGTKASFAATAVGLITAGAVWLLGSNTIGRRRAVVFGGVGVLLLAMLPTILDAGLRQVALLLGGLGIGGSDWASLESQLDVLRQLGSERSLLDLTLSPLYVTFRAERYGEGGEGAAGYLLLALVPLVAAVRLGRPDALMLVAASVGYLVWFWTAQYLRYGIPIAALFSALGASAFVRLENRGPCRVGATIGRGLVLLLALMAMVGYIGAVAVYPGEIPWRVSTRQVTRSDYLAQQVEGYTAVQLLYSEPGVTRVAATSPGVAQIYSPAPVNQILLPRAIGMLDVNRDESSLLRYLDAERYSHILVERTLMLPEFDRSMFSIFSGWDALIGNDEEFLRRNTILVGGDRNVYLYRLLPPTSRGQSTQWSRGPELLLNEGLESASGAAPANWSRFGQAGYDCSGQFSYRELCAVRVPEGSSWSEASSIEPGARYILSHETWAVGGYGSVRLQINWLDADDALVAVSIEVVPTTPLRYRQWSMLARAPLSASKAVVYLTSQSGDAWFDDASLQAFDAP